MAMNISAEGQEITRRFFKAIELLKEAGQIRGLQTVTRRYGLNRRNLIHVANSPHNTVLKPELLHHLVKDYGVSALWLLTGEGFIFSYGSDTATVVPKKRRRKAQEPEP